MSSERLQPGMWCRPSSEREWKAVLEIAEALWLRGVDFVSMDYDRYPRIWSSRAEKTLIYPGNFSEKMSGEIPGPRVHLPHVR